MNSIGATVSNLPMDWIAVGGFALILIVLTLRSGTRIPAALALSLPIAVFVMNALPGTAYISVLTSQLSGGTGELILFGTVFTCLYILVFRMLGQYMLGGAMPLNAVLSGLAATIVALVFWLQVGALDSLRHFGPQIQTLFGVGYRLWWLLGSYLALALTRR